MKILTKNKSKAFFTMFLLFAVSFVFATNASHTQCGSDSLGVEGSIEPPSKEPGLIPGVASVDNTGIVQEAIEGKILNYSNLGYFPQFYEPSLQATYYTLYVLDAIDKLDSIDQDAVLDYIMAQYDSDSGIFMDEYAYRYLGTDFLKGYYPLNTVLEVNCYAVLSLEILNKLDQINSQDFIDYIWSCYNPVTSGFLGQPYSATLTDYFITATMDNTYYAIQALDLLIDSWSPYTTERDGLVQFVNDLQLTEMSQSGFGGFYNDAEVGLNSLSMPTPNLIGSFYCVKTLEVFGLIGTININDYHQFLEDLYDNGKNYFKIESLSLNRTNIVATALGIELSDLTGAPINVNSAVDFVLNNRNSQGLWEGSTESIYHELIDVFQIVRSLNNFGAISLLTANDKNQMASSLENYESYRGYSLISNDYMSMELINTIVNSFDLFDRLPDLDIQGLYDKIIGSYIQPFQKIFDCEIFYPYMPMDHFYKDFRSFPIDYNSIGNNDLLTTDIEEPMTNKWTFMALDALQQIFKLDDFEIERDLTKLSNNISSSQFLEVGYDSYGAFLPSPVFNYFSPDFNEKCIIFEYTYYAIRILEILADQLSLGDTEGLVSDINALYAYISRNVVETSTSLYFNPQYSDNIEIVLKNTYFAIYVLKALGMYDLNTQKVNIFVGNSINYTSIENIYYCYKLSEILDLDIVFNFTKSQELINDIYSEEFREFYSTSDKNSLEQTVLLWLCEMAKLDNIDIDYQLSEEVKLGSYNNLTISLNNLVLNDFGPNIVVKFESDQIGTYTLKKESDGTFFAALIIGSDQINVPIVKGNITIYSGPQIVKEMTISFRTGSISPNTEVTETSEEEDKIEGDGPTDYFALSIPLIVSLLGVPSCVIGVSFYYKNKIKISNKNI